MTQRKAVDRRPGTIPEIRADGDSVTFRLDVTGTPAAARLILRCDTAGEVWAAIVAAPAAQPS